MKVWRFVVRVFDAVFDVRRIRFEWDNYGRLRRGGLSRAETSAELQRLWRDAA